MENIVRRLREQAGITQVELANLGGVTRRYIISLERNVPATIPNGVLVVLSDLSDLPPDSIIETYKQSFNQKSIETIAILKADRDWSVCFNSNMSEFREILGDVLGYHMSQIKFCEIFNVNPAALSAYELGDMRSMPKSIIKVLQSIGLNAESIRFIHYLTVGKK